MIVWIGVFPQTFMSKVHTSADDFFATVSERRQHYSTGAPEPRTYRAEAGKPVEAPRTVEGATENDRMDRRQPAVASAEAGGAS